MPDVISGFLSKKGLFFDARIKLNDEFRTEFEFENYNGQTNSTTPKYYGGIVGVWSGDGDASIWCTESASSVYTAFPTITDNGGGSFTIAATEGNIYYTTDGTNPTTSLTAKTSPCNFTLSVSDDVEVIKAISKAEAKETSIVISYWLPKCKKPTISVSSGTVTITPKEDGETVTTEESNSFIK